MTKLRYEDLSSFLKNINVRFNRLDLLDLALTHSSYINELSAKDRKASKNYERLEFLGDSVLGLVTADYLFRKFPTKNEGDLARIKSIVVSESSLYGIGRELKISPLIALGRGEKKSGGQYKQAIIADCVEAILGAYYLDSDFETVSLFLLRYLESRINNIIEDRHINKDYKSLLQKKVQQKFCEVPRYELNNVTGKDHQQIFNVTVSFNNGELAGCGSGTTKKKAEQQAACRALEKLLD